MTTNTPPTTTPKAQYLDQLPATDTHTELALRVAPQAVDCNMYGDIFGGWLMAQVDIAGAVAAFRVAQGRIATIAVKEFVFLQPVRMGNILSFYASVVRIGNTSITVAVDVYSEHAHHAGKYLKAATATVTYVALDEQGTPRTVQAT